MLSYLKFQAVAGEMGNSSEPTAKKRFTLLSISLDM